MQFEYEYEKIQYKEEVMKELYKSPKFRRIVLGAVLDAADECGYRNSRTIELFHFVSEALDNKTMDELEEIYDIYARNGFKKKRRSYAENCSKWCK